MPGGELPFDGAVVPFDEERAAAGDLCGLVAPVVDDQVNAAAGLLPAMCGGQVVSALACADAMRAGLGVVLVGVEAMGEASQSCGSWAFAEELQEPIRLAPIDGRNHQSASAAVS